VILICTESRGSFKVGHLYEVQGRDFDKTRHLYKLSNNNYQGFLYLPTLEFWFSTLPSEFDDDLAAKFEPACDALDIIWGVEND